jgi:hypothetical protein
METAKPRSNYTKTNYCAVKTSSLVSLQASSAHPYLDANLTHPTPPQLESELTNGKHYEHNPNNGVFRQLKAFSKPIWNIKTMDR